LSSVWFQKFRSTSTLLVAAFSLTFSLQRQYWPKKWQIVKETDQAILFARNNDEMELAELNMLEKAESVNQDSEQ